MTNSATKAVLDVYYIKLIRFSLNVITLWPNKEFGIKTLLTRAISVYHYILIIITSILECLCLVYTWKNRKVLNFIDLGHLYETLMLTAVLLQRLTLSFQKKYCSLLKKFVTEIHLLHHKDKSHFATQEHGRVNKFCSIVVTLVHCQAILVPVFFMLTPVHYNYSNGMFSDNKPPNGTYSQSVYYELPFDYTTDTTGYFVVFAFNWYPSYNVSSAMCFVDLLMLIILCHVRGHFHILMHDLKCFPRPSYEIYQASEQLIREYNKEVSDRLKDAIRHYQLIKEFISDMYSTFDTTMCVYLAFVQLNGCVLLLECSAMTLKAFGEYGPLTVALLQQLIQISVLFEQINIKSDKLIDEVYCLPWEEMDVKNRKMVLIFLTNVQNPPNMKAWGMVPVGVRTMSNIIKTSVSYFIMLKTLAK